MSTRIVDQWVSGLVRITKTYVDNLTAPDRSQAFLRDAELKGFGVRITPSGRKSFILEKRIKGRVRRMTLGPYPDLTVEQARKLAQIRLGEIASGRDPEAEKVEAKVKAISLAQTFEDFIKARKNLKPYTAYNYRRHLTVAFPDWLRMPITEISKDMVAKRHTRLGEERGPSYSNSCLRTLRAVLNFAIGQYDLPNGESVLTHNPVDRLTKTRSWYRQPRRQTLIKAHQLPRWWAAVSELKATDPQGFAGTVADYLKLLLLTWLRRSEGARLRWADVGLADQTLRITETKNNDPLLPPLSRQVVELLQQRHQHVRSEYVFPGQGTDGHLIEIKRQMRKVIQASGVEFALHDLRRTFVTTAESLDISFYAIKRLVNHKTSAIDVTAGYVVLNVERLRKPMQAIADKLCEPDQNIVKILQLRA